jgi:nucleotide-binding universal stress UspA family protein
MKAVLGIDEAKTYQAGLRLFARLGFADPALNLLHVAAQETKSPLEEANQECLALGLSTSERLLRGRAAPKLLEHAEAEGADLVVVGCREAGRAGMFPYGRITRSLSIGSRLSILVAKGEVAATGPLTAVLATDHSEYARRCMDEFVRLAPTGIRKATILTAYHPGMEAESGEFTPSWTEAESPSLARFRGWNEELCERLRPLIPECEVRVVEDEPNRAIDEAMRQTGADLLVLGAQGRGFMARLFVGSVAFRQIVATPHSVLVLRVPAGRAPG